MSYDVGGCHFWELRDSQALMKTVLGTSEFSTLPLWTILILTPTLWIEVGMIHQQPECKPHKEASKLLQKLGYVNAGNSIIIDVINVDHHDSLTQENPCETIR